MKKIKINLCLSKSIVDELEFMSQEINEDKNSIVEKALDYYFSCLGEKIAIKEAEKVKQGKAKLYTFQEVKNENP